MTSLKSDREEEIYRGNARLSTTAAQRGLFSRLFSDWEFATRAVRYALGLPVPMKTEDRRVLEQVIFPYLVALPNVQTVLFAGCDWYTKHYEAAFFRGRTFWSIDPAPRARRYAGKRHIVAPLEQLSDHFPPAFFDLIICNGVYGFGLDAPAQCEAAFDACLTRLRSGGCFLLGWDDIPARTPVPLSDIASLRQFHPLEFPMFETWRYRTNTPYRHTYDLYCA